MMRSGAQLFARPTGPRAPSWWQNISRARAGLYVHVATTESCRALDRSGDGNGLANVEHVDGRFGEEAYTHILGGIDVCQ
jgi:hypothetical protein